MHVEEEYLRENCPRTFDVRKIMDTIRDAIRDAIHRRWSSVVHPYTDEDDTYKLYKMFETLLTRNK